MHQEALGLEQHGPHEDLKTKAHHMVETADKKWCLEEEKSKLLEEERSYHMTESAQALLAMCDRDKTCPWACLICMQPAKGL